MQAAQFELHARIETGHWWFRARQRILHALVRKLVPPKTGQMVLDVGCGTGGTLAGFAEDYACCGIDPSDVAAELAKQRFPKVEFRCGMAPDAVKDVLPRVRAAMLLDVLEHVQDDVSLLKSVVSAMSPGSYCVITVPADMRLWSPQDVSYGHFRRYDTAMLAKTCSAAPAEPVLMSYFNTRLYPVMRVMRALAAWRGKASGEAGTDLFVPHRWVNSALEGIFAGEQHRLCNLLDGRAKGYARGGSLLAILRRNGNAADKERAS